MRSFLVFQLYGPMTSWGDIAVGDMRPAVSRPSKSAVLGMLGAALGIKRDQEERHRALAENYAFGARVENGGTFLRDYHTIQTPHGKSSPQWVTRRDEMQADESGTILSSRDYYLDIYSAVAIWSTTSSPPYRLDKLANALKSPRFVLYLGRKANPISLPMAPQVVTAPTLREALLSVQRNDDLLKHLPKTTSHEFIWEQLTAEEAGLSSTMVAHRNDMPLSRRRWQFERRDEYTARESFEEE